MTAASRTVWPWERLSQSNAGSHDALIGLLGPCPGERWLDVGTGSGGVALRTARAGAEAVGLDVAEEALEAARSAAAAEGLSARFDRGDAQQLPYADASFDVVVSAFGVIFARDHARAAAELARVCRPGGRLGLALMPPGSRSADLWTLVRAHGADDGDHPADWARPGRPEELLGTAFELEVAEREAPPEPGPPHEHGWDEMARSFGPLRALVERLAGDTAALAALREEFLENGRRHGDAPRRYVLVLGRRR